MSNAYGLAMRLIRVRFNLSQAEFAEKTGLPGKTIPDLECGNTPLSLERLDAIAKMLGIGSPNLLAFIKALEETDFLIPPLVSESKKMPSVSAKRIPRIEKIRDRSRRAK